MGHFNSIIKGDVLGCRLITALLGVALLIGCATVQNQVARLPDFGTANDDYFVTRIGKAPQIDADNYRLKTFGKVLQPTSLALDELYQLEMVELLLTVECISNNTNGTLVSTAVWKGFYLYNLLIGLGLDETATGVRYKAADCYNAYHTLEQLKANLIVGALYMNGKAIPPKQGFPLRFLNPGFHGAKQPAWVTEVEVIDRPVKDYGEDRAWDCSPPLAIDATIFSPKDGFRVKIEEPLLVGGAAFGGRQVAGVDLTIDDGNTLQSVEIVEKIEQDHVWFFWKASLLFTEKGSDTIQAKSTDISGNEQPRKDTDKCDGANSWAEAVVKVVR